ncbi:hypothetical protein [Pseudaestuariivita rosea]|uniref:hypothetical protein n=1 Tax=Pseudaestuariivita rosea TaxID=2763263 RepID=UPI001ABB3644|nr:hypothetical protein [Pseudaestuariivita rosea]
MTNTETNTSSAKTVGLETISNTPLSFDKVDVKPREMPNGAKIHAAQNGSDETIEVSLPTHIRTWWILPYVLAPFLLYIAIVLGGIWGIVEDSWTQDNFGRSVYNEAYFTFQPMITLIIVFSGLLFLLYWLLNPRTRIIITSEVITIGRYCFDRKHTGGMRLGYSVQCDGETPLMFKNRQMVFAGLRMSYGPWGEDLPYMVNKYHGAEYVMWLNGLIANAKMSDIIDETVQRGHREQLF